MKLLLNYSLRLEDSKKSNTSRHCVSSKSTIKPTICSFPNGLTILMNSATISISVSSLATAEHSLTEFIKVSFAILQMALFLFSGQFIFGHKPAVFRDCWLLLYIKATISPKKERSMKYAKTMSGWFLHHIQFLPCDAGLSQGTV